jgi:hypothetical protein
VESVAVVGEVEAEIIVTLGSFHALAFASSVRGTLRRESSFHGLDFFKYSILSTT